MTFWNVDGRIPLNEFRAFKGTRWCEWVSGVWDLVINFFHGEGQNHNFSQF